MGVPSRSCTDGLPARRRCIPACGQVGGEYPALDGEGDGDRTPRILDVHCPCDHNHRCAGCCGPVAEQRLSAWYWDEQLASMSDVAAHCGLAHHCA